jgi:hypothetical protein
MKKTLSTMVLCIIFNSNIFAQQWNGNQNANDNIWRTGNVSIGTSIATERLNLRGSLRMLGATDYRIYGDITTGVMGLYGNTNSSTGAFVEMWGGNHATRPGLLALGSFGNNGETWFTNYNTTTNSWTVQAKITANGRFVIGNCTPWVGDYGLYVERGILTSQIKVALPNTNDWSDYVFNTDYKLMPLNELKTYIEENKHLPDVPSAEEVNKTGINLGQMDATLLKKIEELTLYTLSLQKEVTEMKEKINTLEQKK